MDQQQMLSEFLKEGIREGKTFDFERLSNFNHLMMCYRCAMLEVKTKLDVLNEELSQYHDENPIEDIKCRLKTPLSIADKMKRKNYAVEVQNMEKLTDIAGIRVICSFLDDIYMIRDYLVKQDDIKVLEEKDYIKNPKLNGYRSLHLILQVPIFLSNEKKYMAVEVQFRTIAMDFWASSEHKLTYKHGDKDKEVVGALEKCAEAINLVDMAMQEIKDKVQEKKETVDIDD